jgi:hypothetical protein
VAHAVQTSVKILEIDEVVLHEPRRSPEELGIV